MFSARRGSDVPAELRVAMVSQNALPCTGGTETHIDEVASRLAGRGVEVSVITTDRSGLLPQTETRNGYLVRRWPAYPRARDYYLSPGLAQHLMTSDYDVIHVQGVHNLIPFTALLAARRRQIPAVLTFHSGGHSSGARSLIRPVQWRLLGPLLRSAGALIAVSEFERQHFAAELGLPPERIQCIPNGVTALPVDDSATVPVGAPLLVSVGRLERYKGHHRILAAMPHILAEAPQARLMIIGSGPYGGALRNTIAELGLQSRVGITSFGHDERAVLGRVLAAADAVCLLSEYESQGLAAYEALSAGTNVLVSSTSALEDLARAGLATAIPLGATPAEVGAAALGVAAAPSAPAPQLPDWDECADRLLDLYRKTVGTSGVRHG